MGEGNDSIDDRSDAWLQKAYEEGATACRNYSTLTMRVRTLAQHALVVGVAGLAVLHVEETLQTRWPYAVTITSVALLVFAASLFLVDWHYQSAFMAIRNQLAKIECEQGVSGPWVAHFFVRTQLNDHFASYLPFLLLAGMGCFGLWLGGAHSPSLQALSLTAAALAAILFAVFWILAAQRDQRARRIIKLAIGKKALRGGFDPSQI